MVSNGFCGLESTIGRHKSSVFKPVTSSYSICGCFFQIKSAICIQKCAPQGQWSYKKTGKRTAWHLRKQLFLFASNGLSLKSNLQWKPRILMSVQCDLSNKTWWYWKQQNHLQYTENIPIHANSPSKLYWKQLHDCWKLSGFEMFFAALSETIACNEVHTLAVSDILHACERIWHTNFAIEFQCVRVIELVSKLGCYISCYCMLTFSICIEAELSPCKPWFSDISLFESLYIQHVSWREEYFIFAKSQIHRWYYMISYHRIYMI